MKIVIFTQNLGNYISGGRQYPWHMGHCLAYAGHKVLFVTNLDSRNGCVLFDRDFESFPGRNNVEIYMDLNWGTKDPQFMKRLQSMDLFICSPMISMDIGVSLAKNFRKKVIGLLYETQPMIDEAMEFELPEVPEQIRNDFARQLHKTDMIITNNKYCQTRTREWLPAYKGKIEFLYNGFNTIIADKVPNIPYHNREDSVAFLSRAVKYKGMGDFLYIFGQMEKKPKIEFISGFLDMKQPFIINFFKTCKDVGLEIEIHDRVTEEVKFKVLGRSKFLFFPSRFEGFGIPPAEALYMGTPVVAYDLPVLTEFYGNHIFYLPSFDYQSGMDLFNRLFQDSNEVMSKIAAAQNHIHQHCSVDNYTNKVNEIVCKLMGQSYKSIQVKKLEIKKEISNHKINVAEKIQKDITTLHNVETNKPIINWINVKPGFYKAHGINVFFEGQPDIKSKGDMENEILYRFEQTKADFMIFNHKTIESEIKLPGSELEMFIRRPKCIGGVIATRKDITIGDNPFWELELRIKYNNAVWTKCDRILFRNNIKGWPIKKARQLVRNFIEDQDLDQVFSVDNSGDTELQLSHELDVGEKALMIIPARTNKYLPELFESLIEWDRVQPVIVHHEPDGNWDKDVMKWGDKPEIEILQVKGKFNFSKMNNLAFDKFGSKYPYVILCNDDIVLGADTISALLSGFKYRFKDVGIVGAKLVYPKIQKIQHAGVHLLSDKRCIHSYHNFPVNRLCVNYIRKVHAVTFGLAAIDSECYDAIRLNENYPNDLNDIDFCLRAKDKGFETLYNPLASAIHHETITRREFKMTDDFGGRNLFKKEHKNKIAGFPTTQELAAYQKHTI